MSALLVGMLLAVIPLDNVGGDFICFWTAGRLLVQGQDPYDPSLQASLQVPLGWDKATDGLGVYEFMPFYYPLWFAALCVPFGLLGFAAGKVLWLFTITWLLLLGADLLARSQGAIKDSAAMVVVVLFALSVLSILFGQTSPLILFLIAACWWGVSTGRDATAGLALAWLTIKPQLGGILIPAALIWSARQGRWGLAKGFFATLAVLVASTLLIRPDWPWSFRLATQRTPLITDYFPWLGSTWLLLLKVMGLRGIWLWLGYLLGALPACSLSLRAAWRRGGDWESVLALSLLAVFFVSPYSQPYDFMILLPTAMILIGRLPERRGVLLLAALTVLPYLHIALGSRLRLWWLDTALPHRVTFFWVPLLLAAAWLSATRAGRPAGTREGLDLSAPALQ